MNTRWLPLAIFLLLLASSVHSGSYGIRFYPNRVSVGVGETASIDAYLAFSGFSLPYDKTPIELQFSSADSGIALLRQRRIQYGGYRLFITGVQSGETNVHIDVDSGTVGLPRSPTIEVA